MKRRLIVAVLLALFALLFAQAQYTKAADRPGVTYYGVEEIDKGEGVFVLQNNREGEPFSGNKNPDEWGGAYAEFLRRYRHLDVVAAIPIAGARRDRDVRFNPTTGIIIHTVPKGRR